MLAFVINSLIRPVFKHAIILSFNHALFLSFISISFRSIPCHFIRQPTSQANHSVVLFSAQLILSNSIFSFSVNRNFNLDFFFMSIRRISVHFNSLQIKSTGSIQPIVQPFSQSFMHSASQPASD